MREGRVVPFCPECAGGLPVPREPAEIEPGAQADDVLAGRARVRTRSGADVTEAFVTGAELALAACWRHRIRLAILKEHSPSCGVHCVHDGRFTGARIPGQGITARLLERHGIAIYSEEELEQASAVLEPAGARPR